MSLRVVLSTQAEHDLKRIARNAVLTAAVERAIDGLAENPMPSTALKLRYRIIYGFSPGIEVRVYRIVERNECRTDGTERPFHFAC